MELKRYKRTIKDIVLKTIKERPITLITGARQVGKSTLCYELKKELNFNYVSLDDINELNSALTDPIGFLLIHKYPLIIDEIQNAPILFNAIESIVNKKKMEDGENDGMYVITGSQSFELMKNVNESMAGRVGIINMPTLSLSEINNQKELPFDVDINIILKRTNQYKLSIDEVFSYITKGFYPALYEKERDIDRFYEDYLNTYLTKDIYKILNIKDIFLFKNFMEILASLTGEELVYDNIAKLLNVKVDTIKSRISVLITSEIIFLLEPYNETSIVKRVIKRPKIYFNDVGLAAHLAKLNNKDNLMSSYFKGRFVETFIINEIRKSYFNNGINPSFYYYRDNNQNEIDLIILSKGILHLIECKSGVTYNKSNIKSFKQLEKSLYKIGTSAIISNTNEVYIIDNDVYCLPITSI